MLAADLQHDADPAPLAAPATTLFADDDNYLTDAPHELCPKDSDIDLVRDEDTDMLAFDTPADLAARFRDLPGRYLPEQRVAQRIRLSASAHAGRAAPCKAEPDARGNYRFQPVNTL